MFLFLFYYFQAEKFGDSFVLEGKISGNIKKDIHQAVSGQLLMMMMMTIIE